jgi:hypothetical protein
MSLAGQNMGCGDISDDSFRLAVDHCTNDADRGPLLYERRNSPEGALLLIAQEISVQGDCQGKALHAFRRFSAAQDENRSCDIREPEHGARVNTTERIPNAGLNWHYGGDLFGAALSDRKLNRALNLHCGPPFLSA